MLKNQAGQKWRVYAFNVTTNQEVTGDATNITAKLSKDYAAAVALTDVNPTETEDGFYLFDLTSAETNANDLAIYPESSTGDVQVIGVPGNYVTDTTSSVPVDAPVDGDVPFSLVGPTIVVGIVGDVPPPNKVLDGVVYGPDNTLTGTAPESEKSHLPELIRGDDYSSTSTQITSLVADPGDLGLLASCSAIFAGYNEQHGTGWRVTGGTVEDVGAGVLRLRSSLLSADTIQCKPGCNYKWTHTLVDASGEIRTQKHGVTKLVDGYAVARYEE